MFDGVLPQQAGEKHKKHKFDLRDLEPKTAARRLYCSSRVNNKVFSICSRLQHQQHHNSSTKAAQQHAAAAIRSVCPLYECKQALKPIETCPHSSTAPSRQQHTADGTTSTKQKTRRDVLLPAHLCAVHQAGVPAV
jgi:hypothetical protein